MRVDAKPVSASAAVRGCQIYATEKALPAGVRVAIAVSQYNETITGRLLEAAVATLQQAGIDGGQIEIAWVPGAFELPLAADQLAATGRFAAVICLGAVI